MKLNRRRLVIIAIAGSVLVLLFVWWKRRQGAKVESEGTLATPGAGGGVSAQEQNEAREARQGGEALAREGQQASQREREAERAEGHENREHAEAEANAERQLTRAENQEQRNLIMAERQQEYDIHKKEREEATAGQHAAGTSAQTPTKAAAAASVGLGFVTTKLKGKPAHEYSHAVQGGVGPGGRFVILNAAKSSHARGHGSGQNKHKQQQSHQRHRPTPSAHKAAVSSQPANSPLAHGGQRTGTPAKTPAVYHHHPAHYAKHAQLHRHR